MRTEFINLPKTIKITKSIIYKIIKLHFLNLTMNVKNRTSRKIKLNKTRLFLIALILYRVQTKAMKNGILICYGSKI